MFYCCFKSVKKSQKISSHTLKGFSTYTVHKYTHTQTNECNPDCVFAILLMKQTAFILKLCKSFVKWPCITLRVEVTTDPGPVKQNLKPICHKQLITPVICSETNTWPTAKMPFGNPAQPRQIFEYHSSALEEVNKRKLYKAGEQKQDTSSSTDWADATAPDVWQTSCNCRPWPSEQSRATWI